MEPGATVNRRRFLAGAGLVGSLGLVGASRGGRERPLVVTVWFSERAATYDGIESRVTGYVKRAIGGTQDGVVVAAGDQPIPLATEGGARLMEVEWPRMVVSGALGQGPVRPTADVNLLVTDGDPAGDPAGYGMRGIAALGGARLLAAMPPAEDTPSVVPYSPAAAITQLALHECGHALGLEHHHGVVTLDGDAEVASPMVGGYAWADAELRRRQLPTETNACGDPTRATGDRRRKLGLEYGECAAGVIRQYRPGLVP